MRKTLRLIYVSNNVRTKNMIRVCKSCGKEFQNLTKGVLYSSSVRGVLEFCLDECSKNYLNSGVE
jgi:transposase-like protein